MVAVSPTRASHFFQTPKSNQKRLSPRFGPSLRSGSPRSGAAPGARHEGASCPSRLARRPASHPPAQRLHSASLTGTGRKPDTWVFTGCSVENRAAFSTEGVTLNAWTRLRRCPPYRFAPKASGTWIAPFRRANASVVEWVEPHGCGERPNGPWTARVGRPRSGAGVSGPGAQRRAGCPGQAFLVTFAAIGKSDSPGWAKSKPSTHSISSQGTDKAKPVAP